MPITASDSSLSGSYLNAAIMLRWGAHPSVRIWRSNAGQAWAKTTGGGLRPIQVNVPGCPDLTGIVTVRCPHCLHAHGLFLAIETKGAGDRMRESQLAFKAMCERMGAVYVEAHSVEDVDVALAALGVRREAP